jgi:NitT/TauT family transport system ATP-binding protein
MTAASAEPGATPVPEPRLVMRDVSFAFPSGKGKAPTPALDRVSMQVADGAFIALLGPSGCGKTTLLRLANGLLKPDSGEVLVGGKTPLPGPDMGFVFQSFRLIPWENVHRNVEFALIGTSLSAEERKVRAAEYVELVGLGRFADAYPSALSGGMRQRVALARALASEPSILLMDEPFASIDAQTRELMQIELMRLWSRMRSLVLFVTHSVDEAILLADRIMLMGPRPGRIVEEIAVDLPRPRWSYDVRAEPRFLELRAYLWQRIRHFVLSDPASDFYGRDFGSTDPAPEAQNRAGKTSST